MGVAVLAFMAAAVFGPLLLATQPARAQCSIAKSQGVWCGTPCAVDTVKYSQNASSGAETETWKIVSVCSRCCTSDKCDENPEQWSVTLHGSCGGSGPVAGDDPPGGDPSGGT